jgi:hypothetical protein
MTDEIQRAICHEAGHAVAALHLGFPIEEVSVSKGIPFCHLSLDTPGRTQQEQFIVLTAGIAAERHFYRRHNPTACVTDKSMILARGGGPIETYLSEAQRIIELHDRQIRRLIWKLTCRMQEEIGGESFAAGGSLAEPDPPSFNLLSSDDIQGFWRETAEPIGIPK